MKVHEKIILVVTVLAVIVVSVLAYPYILAHIPSNGKSSTQLSVEEPAYRSASKPCKCECFDVLTVEYAMRIRDGEVTQTERVLKRLVPGPGDIYDAVLKPKTELKHAEANYVVESERGGFVLKVVAFKPGQQSTRTQDPVYVLVALNPQNKFGFVLYRISNEEAFAYIVIPGDMPKAQYISVEFTKQASIYDYVESVGYGLVKISYMTREDKWMLVASEISRAVAAIRAIEHPELSSVLEFRGKLLALVVDGGWDCFISCAQICGVADLTLGAICSIACGLCTLEKISCTVCGYCLIVLGGSTLGCLIGCGIGCLIRGG